MNSKVLVSILAICLFASLAECAKKPRGKGKWKKRYDDKSSDLDDDVRALQESVSEIRAALADNAAESSCSGSNVHFYFHGDDGESHGDPDDTRIHIDLNIDGQGHDSHDGDKHKGHDSHENHDSHEYHHSHEHLDSHDSHDSDDADHIHHEHSAHCQMANDKNLDGFVHIVQGDNEEHANFLFDFDVLGDADKEFAVHVHEFGDLSDGCKSLGGHYDPVKTFIDVGDLGTIGTQSDGAVIPVWHNDTLLSLVGRYSIMGRSIIVHQTDGARLGCCVIGYAADGDAHAHDHGK